jgi:hypothetical protein
MPKRVGVPMRAALWRLYDGNTQINATIEDEDFQQTIECRLIHLVSNLVELQCYALLTYPQQQRKQLCLLVLEGQEQTSVHLNSATQWA